MGAVVSSLASWTSDLKVGGSTPSPCHRVVSLFTPHCLSPLRFINGYRRHTAGGNSAMD